MNFKRKQITYGEIAEQMRYLPRYITETSGYPRTERMKKRVRRLLDVMDKHHPEIGENSSTDLNLVLVPEVQKEYRSLRRWFWWNYGSQSNPLKF